MQVTILLATFNGRAFLAAQLDSIAGQSVPAIDVIASDDGSNDGTREILEAAARTWRKGRFTIVEGPRAGSATENFRSLILGADAVGDYVAFCDQDDLWLPGKLARAIAAIAGAPERPLVHCARTELIDAEGRSIGMSPDFGKTPDFRNALVQSLAGGNTMVMNGRAFDLVREASARARFVGHDWWVYQIVTGAGGRIVYAHSPDTLYRQHGGNDIGANVSPMARVVRVFQLFRGRFRRWNDVNIAALTACKDLLTPEARSVLCQFEAARSGSLWHRLAALRESGVYRQTFASQITLYVACTLMLL